MKSKSHYDLGMLMQYADKCISNRRYSKDPDSRWGENLYQVNSTISNSTSGSASWQAAVSTWLSQAAQYNYTAHSHQDNSTGAFTQIVWKGSKHVGCGAKNCSGDAVFVCKYTCLKFDQAFFLCSVGKEIAGRFMVIARRQTKHDGSEHLMQGMQNQ